MAGVTIDYMTLQMAYDEKYREGLAHGTLQHVRQLDADLVLLLGGERVDDTVDGVGGALGVQRAEHQMARFGGCDGGGDGLQIAHLAD